MLRYFKPLRGSLPCHFSSRFGPYKVHAGDLILYRERGHALDSYTYRLARVLGLATHDGMGKEFRKASQGSRTKAAPQLYVLAAAYSLEDGYIRIVDPDDVAEIREAPTGDFARFFLFGAMSDAETVAGLVVDGAMNDKYLAKRLIEKGLPVETPVNAPASYFTVVIPYEPSVLKRTEWHPSTEKGPFSVLARGAFPTEALAHAWAKEHLGGTAYSVRAIAKE